VAHVILFLLTFDCVFAYRVQPEPFFLTFALYNAKEGKKISEDFHFDANSDVIRRMLPSEGVHMTDGVGHSRPAANGASTSPSVAAVDMKWLELQKQVSTMSVVLLAEFSCSW